ncbi:two component transcriptional regulator, LytTR family [Ekhidna lutea]|uniref:Two component transcriptional regulator, LytTR family n=1 Tax=Ekhidna lutea TaxID=447679 RepID=A0A239HI41_EKHLU|nr:LytTR family transcriptional regulator DNA-binding domain-containing protein [Ekhidna lutea]SNS80791.1 two component transcriptional regulator, LytTR family [Ekhidna lutea]
MKTLLVDDTRLARQELQFLLKNHKDVQVIGEAENADEAKTMIEELKPDLVFLDIQMPDKDGFELLEMLDEVPQIVFTTAYSEYAIKAFDYNALDYLKKPITDDRLSVALQRVRENLEKSDEPKGVLNENSQVFVKDGEKCWFVTLKEVRLFEIWDNYTRIYFEDHKPMIPKTLQYMESRLDPKVFFRANRQQIINMKWIDKIEPWFSGTIRLYLKDGTEVEVSRRQTSRFKDLMSF